MNDFWIAFGLISASGIAALCLVWLAALVSDSVDIRKHRHAFAIAVFGLCLFAGAKHILIQVVDCPSWLTYSIGYVEEQPTKATFTLSSPKQIPPDTLIDFAVAIGGCASTNWIARPSAVFGLGQHEVSTADLSPSHITNYLVRITSDYVPEDVYIHDFTAVASKTNLAVTCDFNCSTNLVGAPGIVQHRDLVTTDGGIITGEWPWQTDYCFTARKDNHITILGNFVSRGTDREFRVVVSNETINVWRLSR